MNQTSKCYAYLTPSLHDAAMRLAGRYGVSLSALMRDALEHRLDQLEHGDPVLALLSDESVVGLFTAWLGQEATDKARHDRTGSAIAREGSHRGWPDGWWEDPTLLDPVVVHLPDAMSPGWIAEAIDGRVLTDLDRKAFASARRALVIKLLPKAAAAVAR